MTQNILPRTHNRPGVNHRSAQQADLRGDADGMLRDIAFVLLMTKRVRDQMQADEEESLEPALA